jgi:type I restriction enzyme S subunit
VSFREVPIGAAFDVRNGATPTSGEESYWDGNIPWVTPADLGGLCGRAIAEGSRAITPKGYASCGTQMVPAGSVILSIRAPVGHMAIAKNAMCFNQGCRGLIPRRIIQTDFAYWALLARRPQLEAAGQGTTFIELGRAKLRAERVPVPDLATQRAIADFLDRETARIDQLIEKKQRLVKLLGEKTKAAVKRIVFGQHLDVPFAPNNVAWMPDLPEGWLIQRVARRFWNLDSRRIPLNSEERADLEKVYPYYGASGVIDHVDRYIFDEDLILVGEDGANLVMQSTPIAFIARGKYWVNNHAHILRPTSGPLLFWVHALNQVPYEVYVTGSAQPKLTAEALGNIPVPVPPALVQESIAEAIGTAIEGVQKLSCPLNTSIERLRELRAALITAAVTGQIDVATWGKRGTTDRRLDAIESNMAAAAQPERQQARA